MCKLAESIDSETGRFFIKKSSAIKVDDKVGVCVKDNEKVVSFQNETCAKHCGPMVGRKCETGCMLKLAELKPGALPDNGFVSIKNVIPANSVVHAVIMKNDNKITTLLFDTTEMVNKMMDQVAEFGLTQSETSVIRLVLSENSNEEISQKLGIARSTLKTHMNNIYKKLPEDLREPIMDKRTSNR